MNEGGDGLETVARDLAAGTISRRTALRRMAGVAAVAVVPSALIPETAFGKCPKGRQCKGKCCPKGAKCKKGKCKCTGGKKLCGKKCVDLNTSTSNCGACGNKCSSGQTCVAGVCTSSHTAVCGDGVKEGSEACDGPDLGGQTCVGLGFTAGTLACKPDCTFDTSACTSPECSGDGDCASNEHCDNGNCVPDAICGNGAVEPGETCDGNNLGGATCQSLGFDGGTLACSPDCLSYDTSGCTLNQCSVAGDCPGSDTECQSRTCISNTCGMTFANAGTVVAIQTAGDCKKDVCDGAGNVTTVNDDGDLPDDGNLCTLDVCSGGVPSHPPANPGTQCAAATCADTTHSNGPSVCNGLGTCVSTSPTDCTPYICDPNAGGHCRTGCGIDSHCAPGLTCSGGICVT